MDLANPYHAPEADLSPQRDVGGRIERSGVEHYLAWVAVFALNMALPLLFGFSLVKRKGEIGMGLAVFVLLVFGGWICKISRKMGDFLVIGGFVVGLSQGFPILQMVAGMLGLGIGSLFGGSSLDDDDLGLGGPGVYNQLGGFVVTLITGGFLMGMSVGTGFLLREIKRWWKGK